MKMMNTPISSATKVSIAPLGMTRSYTIIENPEVAKANTLVSKAANATCK